MTTKTKPDYSIILMIFLIPGLYVISRLFIISGSDSFLSAEGLLIGLALIALYQEWLLRLWIYRSRYIWNSVALGLGCSVFGLLDSLLFSHDDRLIMHILIDFSAGFTFGLFLGIIDSIQMAKRKKSTPYSGDERPVLTSKASLLNFDQSFTRGRALLLPRRLIFLTSGSSGQEVNFSEILNMGIGKTLGFPTKLVLYMKEAESLSLNLSMPCFWKKKIAEAMDLNGMKLG